MNARHPPGQILKGLYDNRYTIDIALEARHYATAISPQLNSNENLFSQSPNELQSHRGRRVGGLRNNLSKFSRVEPLFFAKPWLYPYTPPHCVKQIAFPHSSTDHLFAGRSWPGAFLRLSDHEAIRTETWMRRHARGLAR